MTSAIFAAAAGDCISAFDPSKVTVRGRLVHKDGAPLHSYTLRIRSDLTLRPDPYITLKTDKNGVFSGELDTYNNPGPYYIEVIDKPWGTDKERTVATIKDYIPSDMGAAVVVDYLEYQDAFPVHKVYPGRLGLEDAPAGYITEFLTKAIEVNGKGFVVSGLDKISSFNVVERVGDIFETLIVGDLEEDDPRPVVEPQDERPAPSAEWLGSLPFEGFFAGHLIKGEKPDAQIFDINHDRFEFDTKYVLPNARCHYELKEGHLVPYKIEIQYRKKPAEGKINPPTSTRVKRESDGKKVWQVNSERMEPWIVYKAEDDNFSEGIRQFASAYVAVGEIEPHLTEGHFYSAQGLLAAVRNFKNSPLADFILPHYGQIEFINRLGVDAIFGETGILPKLTAYTPKGVLDRATQHLGYMDYTDWRPRKPISEHDTYAKAANLYFDVLEKWADYFFEKESVKILENWSEVRAFSDDLVRHSVRYHRLGGKKTAEWVDPSDVSASSAKRVKIDKIKRALRPITKTDTPKASDIKKLKQALCHIIFYATFGHSWAHDRQDNLKMASLGLKEGGVEPGREDRREQDQFVDLLMVNKYAYLLKDEGDKVAAEFKQVLRDKKLEFKAMNFNVKNIRREVNI